MMASGRARWFGSPFLQASPLRKSPGTWRPRSSPMARVEATITKVRQLLRQDRRGGVFLALGCLSAVAADAPLVLAT